MSNLTVIWLDPGITTGYALASIEDTQIYLSYEQDVWSCKDLFNFLKRHDPDYLGIEDFEYRPGKAKPNIVLYPVELIGVATLWAQWYKVGADRFFRQKAAIGKAHWSDRLLKEQGLYIPGVEHGRDAARHLLHWLSFGYGYQFLRNGPIELVEYDWLANRN